MLLNFAITIVSISDYWRRALQPDVLPDWGLLLLGAVGFWFARRTLIATEVAANAAKESADWLKNAERAWLLVRLRNDEGVEDAVRLFLNTDDDNHTTTSVIFEIACENHGKTPAWITDKRAGGALVTDLPKAPPWSEMVIIEPHPDPLVPGKRTRTKPVMITVDGHQKPGVMLIVFGRIRYRDIFGDRREATFGYRVSFPDGALTPLTADAYNQNR